MIKPLTSLRFFFALCVFFSHMAFLAATPTYKKLFEGYFSEGFLGVSFFFILSGFILSYNYQDKILNKDINFRQFLTARIARIYPVHIFSFLLAIPICRTTPIPVMLSNLFLFQSFIPNKEIFFSMNAPAWSISDEMFFYILFPILIAFSFGINKIYTLTIVLILTIFILWLNFSLGGAERHYWVYISPYIRLFDFMLGIILYNVFVKLKPLYMHFSRPGLLEVISIVLFLLFFFLRNTVGLSFRYSLYYWLPMLTIIMIFALSKFSKNPQDGVVSKILSNKILVYGGEISFCFYMLHYLVIQYSSIAFLHFDLHPMLKVLFIFTVTLLGSVFAYEIIEKPLNKKIKQVLK